MSNYTFPCPHCGQSLEGTEELYGQTIVCPACSGNIEIAAPETPRPTMRVVPTQPPPPQHPTGFQHPRAQHPARDRVALWNPNTAANWSLVFTPAFGAWLHASNWRAIGDHGKAALNMGWFWAAIIFLTINLGSIFIPAAQEIEGLRYLVSFLILIIWYFSTAKSQVRYVKETLHESYQKRSWGKPLGVGTLLLAGYFALAMFFGVAGYKPSADEIAQEVKTMVSAEWAKIPELEGASIQSVTLVHKGGKSYDGFLDAVMEGESLRLSIDVTYDNGMIMLQIDYEH